MTDKLLIEALEQYATAIHERAQGRGSSTECATLYAAVLEAAHRSQQESAPPAAKEVEAVAVVGSDFQLLWTGVEDFAAHARKHGIKVGTLLYTSHAPSESEARKPLTEEHLIELADRFTPNTETGSLNYRLFARAIEAAHGITDAALSASGKVES